jgi:hypothetical protein
VSPTYQYREPGQYKELAQTSLTISNEFENGNQFLKQVNLAGLDGPGVVHISFIFTKKKKEKEKMMT